MLKKINKTKFFVTLALIPILGLLAWFLLTGENLQILREVFSSTDMTKEEVQEHLSGLGIRGQVTLSILAMLQVVAMVLPAEPVQVVSGLTFGFGVGVLICIIGVIVGNTIIYVLYRIYGNSLRSYFDRNLEVDMESAASSHKVMLVIFILYFLPAIPYGMICFLAAMLGMRYHRYIVITTLGAIPSVCIGVGLGDLVLSSSWGVSIAVFAVLMILLVVVMIKKNTLMGKLNAYLEKSKQPYSSKTQVRSYTEPRLTIAYWVFRLIVLGKVRFKLVRKVDTIERPSIVLCNHGAFMDFCYAGKLLKPECPNFIVNRMYFYKKSLGKLMRAFGCFPKSMFTADLESVKNCMRVLKEGRVLAMMPEARLSTVGKFEDIQESTFGFLKKMGVTVYSIKINGNYLAKPKWGHGLRRGSRIEAELDLLFTPEELQALEIAEIKARVEERLYYDEFEWLESHPDVHYRSKALAEGLENILTVCPECGAKYSIVTRKNQVRCEKCGLSTELTDRYAFRDGKPFANFAEWYEWQRAAMVKEIVENPDFALTPRVELRHASKDGKTMMVHAGEGVCTLSREGLTYVGTEFGEEIEKHFPLSQIYRLLFGAGEDFELYEGKELYYFVPEEKRSCVDWYIASTVLNGEHPLP